MIVNGSALLELAPIVNMELSKKVFEGTSYGLSEAGYDIRIKQRVTFIPSNTNPSGFSTLIDFKEFYGKFCLASAFEEFNMPDNLVGIVHDKSTWARQGVSLFNTVIEPGWKGFLTLELVYHGTKELTIPAGSGIAQVIFHQTSESSAYKGKYQNQADKPVAAIFEGK